MRNKKNKKIESLIYWIKDKKDVRIDLSRISFARIEERIDEVFKQFMQPAKAAGIILKKEYHHKNGVFIKIPFDKKRGTKPDKELFSSVFGDGIYSLNIRSNYALVQTDELKKLSISRVDCVAEITLQTGKLIKQAILIVREKVEHLFTLNNVLSEIDMGCAFSRYCCMMKRSAFPEFLEKDSRKIYMKNMCDPLEVMSTSPKEATFFMDHLTSSRLIVPSIGIDDSLHTGATLRIILLGYLGCQVPCDIFRVSPLDFICYYEGTSTKAAVLSSSTTKYQSLFTSELSAMDSIYAITRTRRNSFLLISNFACSTTLMDQNFHLRAIIELFSQQDSFLLLKSQISCFQTSPWLPALPRSYPYLSLYRVSSPTHTSPLNLAENAKKGVSGLQDLLLGLQSKKSVQEAWELVSLKCCAQDQGEFDNQMACDVVALMLALEEATDEQDQSKCQRFKEEILERYFQGWDDKEEVVEGNEGQ